MFFSINGPGKDPGYGQSILHEGDLIFRTPPYIASEITLQDNYQNIWSVRKTSESLKLTSLEQVNSIGNDEKNVSNRSSIERKKNRRLSSTSIRLSLFLN